MSEHDTTLERDPAVTQELHALITDIRVAMLTTQAGDGTLSSRPMYALRVEATGDLWFATSQSASIVEQVRNDGHMLATFADGRTFVVVRGTGRLVRDAAQVRALWNAGMEAWFPKGPDDPAITLIHVVAERADYWESPSAPARLLQMIKAIATSTRPTGGERVGVELGGSTPRRDR